MNTNTTVEQIINGTTFQFFVSLEIKGSHATVNVEPIEADKQRFDKLDNATLLLENIAKNTLSKYSKLDFKLSVNQLNTGHQWFGQFVGQK